MSCYLKTAVITLSTALSIVIPTVAEAITFGFDWTGQIAGFSVTGLFSYDETQSYTDGIVRTSDLDSLIVSFFDPQGNFLRTYTDNHFDAGVNFNFDTQTKQILQSGTYFDPDGINIGDGSRSDGLTFWSKPPQSSTPHVHVDDWLDEFGFPIGFSSHEDVAFPTRTTQELIETGKVGDTYIDRLTELETKGQFAKVSTVPEPTTLIGVLGLGGWLFTSSLQRRKQ
ncbi:MAG: PEP-CTERM sorting domain-containing protein [Moorea sp. SIO3I7]|uniref:PEP-CTERM protein-sorting domain-containing protein n=1 Tax=Moorena bouillonii PNG TaxID=568701 RepID=A0A1U7N8J5_9CYAN|nr:MULTISPECIES: PEP-CTERM sorting domain-containing protein [Moorena]NEN96772.1 PEP-CTERM sorting domain-containing protein [Moorena sp. SIO3I7]NEO44573.1 PEP-CTERM sorting domain-containing protein [Moorena sp. SIO4A3]NEO10485.1 PEP-CTERM sorting domain-containing protein [Moorena sp. SIO3I8]NEO12274.1 PEP-CTERM sorting domain-containing protein [Moorena sp. SIO3E8]NEO24328.1 PEP-CTERM sorting domain-containing protein [Moorena sp. SIO4A5]